jgi:hypothetical protein
MCFQLRVQQFESFAPLTLMVSLRRGTITHNDCVEHLIRDGRKKCVTPPFRFDFPMKLHLARQKKGPHRLAQNVFLLDGHDNCAHSIFLH